MGRIKSLLIKRASKQLIEEKEIPFTTDFETNKKLLSNLMPSKPLRNKIAGYITRLKRIEIFKNQEKANIKEELKN